MEGSNLKKLLILLLVGVFITACSSNDETEKNTNSTENDDKQATENIEIEDEKANDDDKATKKELEETETNNSNESDSELTEDEAKEQLIDYINKNEPGIKEFIDIYDILMEKEDDKYRADIYPPVSTDEDKGRALIASYEIDRVTGEVEKIEDESTETKSHLSEIVDFSKKERRAHHEELAGGPEHIQEKVYEHLMLPGIHENTKKYEGRINPGERIRFRFPDAEKFVDRSTDDPEVSEEGYFSINLAAYEFKAGQDILVSITKGYPQEQTFTLTVNEAQEGMEEIRVR